MAANIYTRLLLDLSNFDANLSGARKSADGFKGALNGALGTMAKWGGFASAAAAVGTALHGAMVSSMELEKSLSSLQALTGVSRKELEMFRAEAIRMSMGSTQSATELVEAFKLIGGQMPELLKNRDALTATAQAAVTLADAAELDVPTAAKALTGALNQMGASSAQAEEYINILAAASMEGAAEIPYLNQAIEKAGGTASMVGISFSDLVASIEAIAPRITDASSAGLNLRNIFLILESSTDERLRPSVVGLTGALKNLAGMHLSATQLTKMFGRESVTAAIALLQERDNFEHLRTAIVGTNTANEQAAINTDNLSGSVTRLGNSWQAFTSTVWQSNGLLQGAVDTLRGMVDAATLALSAEEVRYRVKTETSRRIETEESTKRIQRYMSEGLSGDEALAKEKRMADLMYPQAGAMEQRLKEMKRLKAEWDRAELMLSRSPLLGMGRSKARQAEQAYEDARKLYEESRNENTMRQAIYENVERMRGQLEASAAAQKKLNTELQTAQGAAPGQTGKAGAPEGSLAALREQMRQVRTEMEQATTVEAMAAAEKTMRALEGREMVLRARVEATLFQAGRTAPAAVQASGSGLGALAQGPSALTKIEIPTLKPAVKDAKDLTETLSAVNGMFGAMQGLVQGNTDSMGRWALQSMASVAQMILQLQSLATANGVASAMSLPFPASLAAVATVIGTVASVFASLPKFEDGGIVGGSSYFGDRLLARVNSGEMILNRRQQQNLYAMTEAQGSGLVLTVDRVRGSDLVLAIRNELRRTGQKL